jgi:3'-phosphoadenosine 5'-phosphosulfate sulfotransferase (PAPS reductase)/FAD synthetase
VNVDHVIFASYGNDSVALIQWAHERGLSNVHVAYSNTGWAAEWWVGRVERGELWAQSLGFATHRIDSEGMEALVARKSAWPRGGGGKFQFCTEALKERPAQKWLAEVDPQGEATVLVGVRREESANRRDAPEHVLASERHGGRELWQPLVRHNEGARDSLVQNTPMPLLPFRSKECYPCVNARKPELRFLDDEAKTRIIRIEKAAGINSKGNARVMFSPARHGGAVGIEAVIEEAKRGIDDLFLTAGCSSGWCG